MKHRRRLVITLVVLSLLGAVVLQAQRARQGARFNPFLGVFTNTPPETEFVMARWHYTAGWGGGGWSHDYPTAEEHILQIMKEVTGINVERLSYRVVELSSPEIFEYPFAYVSEPGEMLLTEQEVVNLREYISRGGFVMIDDFGGQGQGPVEFETFRDNLIRAFPDRDMFVLRDDHSILNTFYEIDSIQTVHPMSGVKSVFYGYPGEKDELSMIVCYANDVGDYWEWSAEGLYGNAPTNDAYRLGVNYLVYEMTH